MTTDHARVLVADDDDALRTSTIAILGGCGFAVEAAEDGQEALEKLTDGDTDAVVLDVKMPKRDGISVVDEMFPEPPPPAILLVSAYDIDRETRRRLDGRVHKVVRKPVPPSTLIEAVSEAVRVAKAARQA